MEDGAAVQSLLEEKLLGPLREVATGSGVRLRSKKLESLIHSSPNRKIQLITYTSCAHILTVVFAFTTLKDQTLVAATHFMEEGSRI